MKKDFHKMFCESRKQLLQEEIKLVFERTKLSKRIAVLQREMRALDNGLLNGVGENE